MVKKPDIIDLLTTRKSSSSSVSAKGVRSTPPLPGIMAGAGVDDASNVFSVSVGKGEERRARVFLERVKTVLQVEPGRLVI